MTALTRPISYSQMSTYLRCPKLHDYRYRQGLQSLRPSRALRIGSLVDTGLTEARRMREDESGVSTCAINAEFAIHAAYNEWSESDGISQALNMNADFLEESVQTRDDALSIAARAIDDLDLDGGRWVTMRDGGDYLGVQYKVEHSLRCHEPGFIGYIDWLVIDNKDGSRWIVDDKTRASFQSDDQLAWDYQLAGYQHAVADKFGDITGVAHYQIKSKVVVPPRTIKGGTLSKAVQACDWKTYERTIFEGCHNPGLYVEMQEKLPKFQTWTWTRRSREELANTWEQIEMVAAEVVEALNGNRPALRVLNHMTCTSCDMKSLCMAELKGHDADFLRRRNYKVREYETTTNQPAG